MHKINYKYGERIELKRDENVTIGDTLSVTLKYFTHKMPYLNGPTKATAYLTVSKGTISEEILLSVIGTSVKSESKEQYEMVQEFSTVMWKGYVFKLEKLDYGTSIEIVVLKE